MVLDGSLGSMHPPRAGTLHWEQSNVVHQVLCPTRFVSTPTLAHRTMRREWPDTTSLPKGGRWECLLSWCLGRRALGREALGATCIQLLASSWDSTIHTRYHIFLCSSSMQEPRYLLLRVVWIKIASPCGERKVCRPLQWQDNISVPWCLKCRRFCCGPSTPG